MIITVPGTAMKNPGFDASTTRKIVPRMIRIQPNERPNISTMRVYWSPGRKYIYSGRTGSPEPAATERDESSTECRSSDLCREFR